MEAPIVEPIMPVNSNKTKNLLWVVIFFCLFVIIVLFAIIAYLLTTRTTNNTTINTALNTTTNTMTTTNTTTDTFLTNSTDSNTTDTPTPAANEDTIVPLSGRVFNFSMNYDENTLGLLTDTTRQTNNEDGTVFCESETLSFANSNIQVKFVNGSMDGCYPAFGGENLVVSQATAEDGKVFTINTTNSETSLPKNSVVALYKFSEGSQSGFAGTMATFSVSGDFSDSEVESLTAQIKQMISTLTLNNGVFGSDFDEIR